MRAKTDSATRRRQCRRNVRNVLGTSRDDAPEAGQAVRAAEGLDELIRLASDGRFAVAIVDQRSGEAITSGQALKIVRGEAA